MKYDQVLIERRTVPAEPRLSLLADAYVEAGTKEDWDRLHELHYKAEKLPFGPKFFRCVLAGEVIGVGVMAMPKTLLSGRNEAFPRMKPNQNGKDSRLVNRTRMIYLNKNSMTNSRLVLDTMYRGAGIAYRMQNLMMRMTGCEVIEFQSSMSKFNPFAAKAGIRFTAPRKSQHHDKGVAWFRRWFETPPADYVGVLAELRAMPEAARVKCEREMRDFYYQHSALEKTGSNAQNGTAKVDAMPIAQVLKNLQQLVLASPLYGAYLNPDAGRDLPARIPLLAFDAQPVDAPLDLSFTSTPEA